MSELIINEDYLLLLVNNNGYIETKTIEIDKCFSSEDVELGELCQGNTDNLDEIFHFISSKIQPKLTNKVFNYCKQLDGAYQSVIVNVDESIKSFETHRNLIYFNEKLALKKGEMFDVGKEFSNYKVFIRERIQVWFKAFNIDFAYEKAKKVSNMLVYSHRRSGWSNPEYRITENLTQQIKTNFGYGRVSYFFVVIAFKNIQITPFSDWIDYKYSMFSEVIRYSKRFHYNVPKIYNNNIVYYKVKISNSSWSEAIAFTQNAANLSMTDENRFIKEFVIDQCEIMVDGLEYFYRESEFEFIDESEIVTNNYKLYKRRENINGYELIDFRTEKIVGALDFIDKIREYNVIAPTSQYEDRIVDLNKRFIPKVYSELENQKSEISDAKKVYELFLPSQKSLIEKNEFYDKEKIKLGDNFYIKFKDEYYSFIDVFDKSNEAEKHHLHKIKLHSDNADKLNKYIEKYKKHIRE